MSAVTAIRSFSFPASVRRIFIALGLAMLVPLLSACGFNTIPTNEEKAKAAWSEVQNQYQRRADLVPNLVETVKGYAAHEKETLRLSSTRVPRQRRCRSRRRRSIIQSSSSSFRTIRPTSPVRFRA